MPSQEVLATPLQGPQTRAFLEYNRKKRIEEALAWESGSREKPRKHLIAALSDGVEVYFLKPGKEVFNERRPNPHDMLPVVGSADSRLDFKSIWSHLSKVSVIDLEDFKYVLSLVYRCAYFVDHVQAKDDLVRYRPSDTIVQRADHIDREVGGVSPYGLIGLLHFLDILGWNEDMKYHVESNAPTFSGQYDANVGRINTLLTCIRVPYQASLFVDHCLSKVNDKKSIDFLLLYSIMQQFAKSRGTCTPTKQQLLTWLFPYIVH